MTNMKIRFSAGLLLLALCGFSTIVFAASASQPGQKAATDATKKNANAKQSQRWVTATPKKQPPNKQPPKKPLPTLPKASDGGAARAGSEESAQKWVPPARRGPPPKEAKRGSVQSGDSNGRLPVASTDSSGKRAAKSGRSRLFVKRLAKRFTKGKSKKTHRPGMVQDPTNLQWRPRGEAGALGRYLGGGFNARVYADPKRPGVVHKLVPIESFAIDAGEAQPPVVDVGKVGAINDQLAGREMLKLLRGGFAQNNLANMMSVAELENPPEIWRMTGPFGQKHRYVHTVEENISSPVYYTDANNVRRLVRDENGNEVRVTDARERLEVRAKERKRREAEAKGQRLKLSEIQVSPNDAGDVLSLNEEVTINAVIRSLNRNGIVWTDHKLENLDVVSDPRSQTGYRVIFFDFDAFRPVIGQTPEIRAQRAREMQTQYDHSPLDAPAPKEAAERRVFDYTAFGGEYIPTVSSPNANWYRSKLPDLDKESAQEFSRTLQASTVGRVKPRANP